MRVENAIGNHSKMNKYRLINSYSYNKKSWHCKWFYSFWVVGVSLFHIVNISLFYSLNVKKWKIRVKTISLEKSEISLIKSEFSLFKSETSLLKVTFLLF